MTFLGQVLHGKVVVGMTLLSWGERREEAEEVEGNSLGELMRFHWLAKGFFKHAGERFPWQSARRNKHARVVLLGGQSSLPR